MQTYLGPITGAFFAFGARTGGLNDNQFIDNLSITTYTSGYAFVASRAPTGKDVPVQTPLDIVLTNSTSLVNTSSIVLKLDGVIIKPAITLDANNNNNTIIHYAPATPWSGASAHTVSLVFADDATPTPKVTTLDYTFTAADDISSITWAAAFTEDFEGYKQGELDANDSASPNKSNNNLSGNGWFGPYPGNDNLVGAMNGVTPHSGAKMLVASVPAYADMEWFNIAYRLHGGLPFMGNCQMDFWFYDPTGPGHSEYADYAALLFYTSASTNADWPNITGQDMTAYAINQRLSLGASPIQDGTFDSTVYQARVVGSSGGYNANGDWFNLPTARSIGWHHGRVTIGHTQADNTASVYFYIDDMSNAALTHNSVTSRGYNTMEINSGPWLVGTANGYYDDFSFSVAAPGKLAVTSVGTNAVLNWTGQFVLQSAATVAGPYTNVTGSAYGPYTTNVTTGTPQFFRLRSN